MTIGRFDSEITILEEIGRRLADYRIRVPLTQAELAEKVGAAHNTEASWEKGDREPTMQQLYMIAKWSGRCVSDFFPPMVSESEKVMEKELLSDFRGVNDQGQALIAAAVKGLSQMQEYRKVY